MRAYLEIIKKKFISNTAYRFNTFTAIFNTVVIYIVFCLIYKVLYKGADEVFGIKYSMVTTNFLLSLALSSIYNFDDEYIHFKLIDGQIANEFVKPLNYKLKLFSESLGDNLYSVIFKFFPACIFAYILTDIEMPCSAISLFLFMVGAILGYIILWEISFIVQILAFFMMSVFGISVIKNVIINILSGSMIPLWFMPDSIIKIIKFTPFDAIFFTPIKIYLGQIIGNSIFESYIKQIIWIMIFYIIGDIIWRLGQKKLIVQGG